MYYFCPMQKEIAHLRDFMRQHSLDSPKIGYPLDYRQRYTIAVDFDKADTVRVNDRVNSGKNRPYALMSRLHNNDAMLGVKTCCAARTCCAGRALALSASQSVRGPGPAWRYRIQGLARWLHAWRWRTWQCLVWPPTRGGALLWRHMHTVYAHCGHGSQSEPDHGGIHFFFLSAHRQPRKSRKSRKSWGGDSQKIFLLTLKFLGQFSRVPIVHHQPLWQE